MADLPNVRREAERLAAPGEDVAALVGAALVAALGGRCRLKPIRPVPPGDESGPVEVGERHDAALVIAGGCHSRHSVWMTLPMRLPAEGVVAERVGEHRRSCSGWWRSRGRPVSVPMWLRLLHKQPRSAERSLSVALR